MPRHGSRVAPRITPAPVEVAHHVVGAGQAALVVEDARILPVEPLEDLQALANASKGRVELAGHLLEPIQIALIPRFFD